MDLKGKKVLVVTTTDDMIQRFLIPHIKQLQNMGAIVECACNKTGYFFDDINKQTGCTMNEIAFTRFPFTLKNFKGRKKILQLCKEHHIDIIHCHQPVGGVMGRIVSKKLKIPCIYTAHGFHFFKGAPCKNNLIYKTIEKHYAKATDALITMNEEDYTAAKQFKAKKVYKINGVGLDLTKYKLDTKKDLTNLKKQLGVTEKDFIILTVGELNKNKNTQVVFKTIRDLKEDNIKLLVCGDGPLKQELENFVELNKLQDRIKILGFRRDIFDILNIADVFVMPSFREGLPKATMEAMAYGLPIIASNIRGCRDLIENGENGILINPKNYLEVKEAIQKIRNNQELYRKFSINNKEKIKKYSLPTVLNQMEKIYKEL